MIIILLSTNYKAVAIHPERKAQVAPSILSVVLDRMRAVRQTSVVQLHKASAKSRPSIKNNCIRMRKRNS